MISVVVFVILVVVVTGGDGVVWFTVVGAMFSVVELIVVIEVLIS